MLQADSAIEWILNQQQEDGGWSDGYDPRRSSPGLTADAIVALWAAEVITLENSPTPFLEDFVSLNRSTMSVALAAKLMLITPIINRDPTDFDGVNLIEIISAKLAETSMYEYCYALVAFYVTDTPLPENTLSRLSDSVQEDGGWGYEETSDTNTTAMCIQASIAYGLDVTPALAYLRTVQNEDGGWPFEKPGWFSTETEAYSTAQVMLALNAAGENLADWNNPQETLLQFQQENGAFNLTLDSEENQQLLVTVQAIPALQGISLLNLKQTP